MTSSRALLLATAAVTAMSVLPTAHAATQLRLSATPKTVRPGATVHIRVRGAGRTPCNLTVRADRRGAAVQLRRRIRSSTRLKISPRSSSGRRIVRVQCGRRSATARFTVRAAPTPAPFPSGVPVVCSAGNGSVTLYALQHGTLRQFARLNAAVTGWSSRGLSNAIVDCHARRSWSKDFSKYVFSAVPPGGDRSVEHLGVIDVRTGAVQDLTVPRQLAGFSAPVLSEASPEFLGTGGPLVTFGSEVVFFQQNTQYHVLALNHPAMATPVQASPFGPSLNLVTGNHVEQQIDQGFEIGRANNRPLSSPDGSLIAWNTQTDPSVRVWPAAAPPGALVDCPAGDSDIVLGWRDPTHLAIASHSLGSVGLATLAADGTLVSCRALIPPSPRSISQVALSLDGTKLFFAADGPSGLEQYFVSTLGESTSEPQRATRESIPAGSVVFFPAGP